MTLAKLFKINIYNESQVKNSYRQLARQYHPDSTSGQGSDVKMSFINGCYELLRKYQNQVLHLEFNTLEELVLKIKKISKLGADIQNATFESTFENKYKKSYHLSVWQEFENLEKSQSWFKKFFGDIF